MNKYKHFVFPQDTKKSLKDLKTKNPIFWEKQRVLKTRRLANFVIQNVPAYKKFLKRKKIQIKEVKSMDDFNSLPTTNKQNYLKKSEYKELFSPSSIDKITTISSTSGSTGEPFYFPRGEEQDAQYEYVAEMFLKNQFEIDKKRTLAINGFGLGIWIGGIFTYKVLNKIAAKGYKLSIAPTGRDKATFLKTFKKLAPLYDQIILMGYPPFIKDVVDEANNYGINLNKYNIKILAATEGFSETFRDYLIRRSGIENIYTDTLNIYGSVEFGTMSHETPLSILIRRIAVGDEKVFNSIFPGAKTVPTLVQYYPHIVNFEAMGGEVVATGYGSSIPLIRYRFFDRGGVYEFSEMIKNLNSLGIDILSEAKKAGISKSIMKLPFVYVHERSDFVVILGGANIYPGNIKSALESDNLETYFTGKFTMIKKEDKKLDGRLEINIELKKGKRDSKALRSQAKRTIIETLLKQNSEFVNLYRSEKRRSTPIIKLYSNEHPKYFSCDQIKQKWMSE